MRRERRRVRTETAADRRLAGIAGLGAALGAALAAVLLSGGPALAGTGFGQLIVNPGTAAPGQSVSVLGTCPNNGSALRGVFSDAFAGGAASVKQTSINFSGSATIAKGASGRYAVTADCGSGSPSVTITVSGAGAVTSTAPAPRPTTKSPTPMPPATRPAGGMSMSPPATHASTGGMKPTATHGAAIIGGTGRPMSPNPSASGMATGAGMASNAMASAAPGMSAAGNGPVTSTGVVRVGLAGSSNPLTGTVGALAAAAALVVAAGAGILLLRRHKSTTSGTNTHI